MSAAKPRFYQHHDTTRTVAAEGEIRIGDLTLVVQRFSRPSQWIGEPGRKEDHVIVKVMAHTDAMGVWRRLDRMRVFHKIERAKLKDSDDLARLLVACGLKHVAYPGAPLAADPHAEERRIKELHR